MRGTAACALAMTMTMVMACGAPAGPNPMTSEASPITRIHKARCGACHLRVEAGERTRAQLESALARHRKRVHLRDEQWAQMIDYLAATNTAGAAPP